MAKQKPFFMQEWEIFKREHPEAIASSKEFVRIIPNPTLGYIYFARKWGLVKIGCTKKPPLVRMTELKTSHPHDIRPELLHTIRVTSRKLYEVEKEYHNQFVDKRVQGEWFDLSDEDIEMIKEIDEI